MNEDERELLLDIFENTEAPEKIKIVLDPRTRDVTIVYEDCDDEWFRELQAAQQSVQRIGGTCPDTGLNVHTCGCSVCVAMFPANR